MEIRIGGIRVEDSRVSFVDEMAGGDVIQIESLDLSTDEIVPGEPMTYAESVRLALAERAVELGVASHNLFDLAYTLVLAHERKVQGLVGIEMLEGISRPSSGRILFRGAPLGPAHLGRVDARHAGRAHAASGQQALLEEGAGGRDERSEAPVHRPRWQRDHRGRRKPPDPPLCAGHGEDRADRRHRGGRRGPQRRLRVQRRSRPDPATCSGSGAKPGTQPSAM